MCDRIETAAVQLGGVDADYARGITGPLLVAMGDRATIYPAAIYYFIVREAALHHDAGRAASALAEAYLSGALLRLKDLPVER
jgi:hypothetical protein